MVWSYFSGDEHSSHSFHLHSYSGEEDSEREPSPAWLHFLPPPPPVAFYFSTKKAVLKIHPVGSLLLRLMNK